MKKSLLIHAGWLAAAAGAYVLGTTRPGSAGLATRDASAARQSMAPARPATGSAAATADAKSAAATATADMARWLSGFRDKDGVITPQKMSDAVQAAMHEGDPILSMLYFAQLVKELTPENAPAALKAVRENTTGFDSMRFMGLLGYAWGQKDGKAAMAAIQDLGGRDGGMMKGSAISGWAATDPEAAMKWMSDLKAERAKEDPQNSQNPQDRARARDDWGLERGMITGLARKDFDAAMKYVAALPADQQAQYAGVLVEQKLKDGAESAGKWAMELTDEKMRASALQEVSRQFLRQDSKAAADWAAGIAGQAGSKQAVGEVAGLMAEKNAVDALAWAGKLPAGASQNEAYAQVMNQWSRSDPTAASEQLTTMAAGPARDAAINSFSRNLARENPQDAMTWASAVTDPQQRLDTQIEVARRWKFSQSGAEADAWIAANLSPEAQAKVAAPPDNPFGGRFGGPGGGGPGGGPPGFGGAGFGGPGGGRGR